MAHVPKKYTQNMLLRVNPTTTLHQRIAARGVEHRDAFIHPVADGNYLWLVEHRAGGRDAPVIETAYYLYADQIVPCGEWELMRLRKAGGIMGPIRLNALRNPHPDSPWLRATHHRDLLPLLRLPPRANFYHVNIMCHYIAVADLDPNYGFPNHWSGRGGKS